MADTDSLKTYIAEQQRYHDELTQANRGIRTKNGTYIGATLALLAFLYSGAVDSTKSTAERLFIPNELYGQVFYFFGLVLVLFSLGKLIHGARPNGTWTVAVESKDTHLIENMSSKDYLIKLKNDYENARQLNVQQFEKNVTTFKDAFYPLLLGAIILIILRYFQ